MVAGSASDVTDDLEDLEPRLFEDFDVADFVSFQRFGIAAFQRR